MMMMIFYAVNVLRFRYEVGSLERHLIHSIASRDGRGRRQRNNQEEGEIEWRLDWCDVEYGGIYILCEN